MENNQPATLHTGISAEPQQPQQAPNEGVSTPPDGGAVRTTSYDDSEMVDNPSYTPEASDSAGGEMLDNPSYAPPVEPKESSLAINPEDTTATKVGKAVGGLFSGIGEGVFSSAAGIADIAHAPAQARQLLHTLAGDNEVSAAAEHIGQGGETLAEFLLGDAALKALPMAKRLEVAAKSLKVIEGSPKLAQALQVGTKILKLAALHGTEAGIVQGAQTAIRTPGDLGEKVTEGLKEGAETGVGATALGVPMEAIGEGLQAAGKIAGKVQNLSNVAEGAKGKEEVVQELSNRIKGAKAKMNGDFETGINDIKARLGNVDIDPKDTPLSKVATDLLAKPNPEENPLVVTAKEAAGDKLDKSVRGILEMASKGEIPVEAEAAAGEAPTILDASGNPIKSTTDLAEPATKPIPNYTVADLIKFRQAVRSLADSYELGDINARVLRKVNNAVDDTIGKLAEKSHDPEALADYQKLRGDYRDKVNVFDDPIIEKLHEGKVDDAAKAFVGVQRSGSALPSAGKTVFNTDQLKTILGEDGVHAFAKDVFGTMLKDSMEHGRINPAKFAQTWARITDQTKEGFFNVNDASNGLKQLAKDAQSGERLQHLTRLGVLGAIGATAGGAIHPVGVGLGTLLGLTVAEGGGLAAGRDLLNYIANHPRVWATYEAAGKTAAKSTGTATKAVAAGATDVLNKAKKSSSLKQSLDSISSALQ